MRAKGIVQDVNANRPYQNIRQLLEEEGKRNKRKERGIRERKEERMGWESKKMTEAFVLHKDRQ